MGTFALGIKMRCSKCGAELHIDEKPIHKTSSRLSVETMNMSRVDVDMGVYVTELMIEPCKGCIEKITGPAQKVIDALETISAINKVNKDDKD